MPLFGRLKNTQDLLFKAGSLEYEKECPTKHSKPYNTFLQVSLEPCKYNLTVGKFAAAKVSNFQCLIFKRSYLGRVKSDRAEISAPSWKWSALQQRPVSDGKMSILKGVCEVTEPIAFTGAEIAILNLKTCSNQIESIFFGFIVKNWTR